MTTSLHIENTVHDFATWKRVFDSFAKFRSDRGVRSYRIARHADDGRRVVIDLDFDGPDEALAFRGALEQIFETPQSQETLISHDELSVLDVVESAPAAAPA